MKKLLFCLFLISCTSPNSNLKINKENIVFNDNLTFKVPDSIKKPIDKKMYANATIKIVDKFADSNEDVYTTRQGNNNLIFSKLCEEYNNIMFNNTEYLKKSSYKFTKF